MKNFLEREPERFKAFGRGLALQDAIITLKHAIAMEEFNMKVYQIGIPITLSSMGRKYVLKNDLIFFNKITIQVYGNT
jgi:hypothetical protein